jgi:hypothetical protein
MLIHLSGIGKEEDDMLVVDLLIGCFRKSYFPFFQEKADQFYKTGFLRHNYNIDILLISR